MQAYRGLKWALPVAAALALSMAEPSYAQTRGLYKEGSATCMVDKKGSLRLISCEDVSAGTTESNNGALIYFSLVEGGELKDFTVVPFAIADADYFRSIGIVSRYDKLARVMQKTHDSTVKRVVRRRNFVGE